MINFEGARRYYPGYANVVNAVNSQTGAASSLVVSYVVPLLPYMERADLYRTYSDASQTPASVYQAVLVCPSNPPTTLGGPQLAYVVNAGYDSSSGSGSPGTVQSENPSDGVSFNRRVGLHDHRQRAGENQRRLCRRQRWHGIHIDDR